LCWYVNILQSFKHNLIFASSSFPFVLKEVLVLCILFIYVYLCSTLFPYEMISVLTVTRRVSLLDQELLNRPEYLSSPPVFCGVRVSFCVAFCRSLFVLFLLAIVSSVLLLLTGSHCPFCIFKFSESYVYKLL
jgi:hypothetical protein